MLNNSKFEKTIKLKKGESFILPENITIRFVNHSHKETNEPSDGRFLAEFEFIDSEKKSDTHFYTIYKADQDEKWREYNMKFTKSEYGEWQEFIITNTKNGN